MVLAQIDPACLGPYDDHYRQINPLVSAIRQLPPGDTVFVDRMLVPRRELDRTEFYNDFLAPQDLHSVLGLSTIDDAGQPISIAVWRSRRRPPWGEDEMRLLRRIGPHLGRALKIERRLAARTAGPATMASPLSWREQDCLVCLARGATSKIAARALGLSVLTVDDYIASAMAKLGAVTRAQAVARAMTLGLLIF